MPVVHIQVLMEIYAPSLKGEGLFIKWGSYPSMDYGLRETNECNIIIFLFVQVMRSNSESNFGKLVGSLVNLPLKI